MSDLTNALRAYQQADNDGVMVLVSRQACDEGAARIEALERDNKAIYERAHMLERENAALREAGKKALDFACEHEGELHGSTYLELVRLLREATEGHSQGGVREHAPGCKSFEEPGCDCGAMLP